MSMKVYLVMLGEYRGAGGPIAIYMQKEPALKRRDIEKKKPSFMKSDWCEVEEWETQDG